ncbi:MAG TPA: HAMP domain-containing sensor histidine kinase [Burkholderiaceae bacterium]|nr:HAMP domain-containing sensor histidine kinase [Burkholderiaceae bacterium]
MKSLRARVLLLIVGFGMTTAALLALIMYASVSQYYSDWLYDKACSFADRIIETHPGLWRNYEANPDGFGQQLRQYTLYSPHTGLYLLGADGRVLASAGDSRPFWDSFRLDLERVRAEMQSDPNQPIHVVDPDRPRDRTMAAARPIHDDGDVAGWLLVVPRQMHFSAQMPEMLRSYALRTAAKIGLLTIALGALMTIATITMLTRPLTALTRATEQVRNSGFCGPSSDELFPDTDRDDEIGKLSRTFREAFERLSLETERVQAADAKRREMIASVSHDLRTPLTALTGQIETIRLKGDDLSDEARDQLLERALHNAGHLRRMTDSLAELARLDSPDFRAEPEPIAIGELADDVVHRYVAKAQQAGIALEIDYPDGLPLTSVDAGLIERALANLLDNALRVTPSGGRVLVRALHDGAGVRLEVVDSGPGVLPEDQPRVFDRFFQTSRAREQRGSSGLGLAIVKRVAELHGGQVGLKSEPGHGSTFFIELPLSA